MIRIRFLQEFGTSLVTIEVASDEVAARKEKVYLNKLNLAMVQVALDCTFDEPISDSI